MEFLSPSDWQAMGISLKIAALTTLILLIIGTPLAWLLSHWQSSARTLVETIVALPLVLPPTVLGFYLLVFLSPQSALAKALNFLGIHSQLTFSQTGMVIGSVLYSLPFCVQPLIQAFSQINPQLLQAAASLRATPWDRFIHVVLPLARPGFLMAATLTFAHTLGEFGVVLMVGGNIPGQTQVVSIAIFDHVEAFEYTQAHGLAGLMLIFSLVVLFMIYSLNRKLQRRLL